jgi:hypothetical protein
LSPRKNEDRQDTKTQYNGTEKKKKKKKRRRRRQTMKKSFFFFFFCCCCCFFFFFFFFVFCRCCAISILSRPLRSSFSMEVGAAAAADSEAAQEAQEEEDQESMEKQALLRFKASIHGDPHQVLSSWSSTPASFPCNGSWAGISCSSSNGDLTDHNSRSGGGGGGRRRGVVISVDLRGSNLTGTISAHIFNLTFLRRLDLSGNFLSGEIPSEVGNLPWLEELDLARNLLSGRIPRNLGRIGSSLLELSVAENRLEGEIPEELANLTQLRRLYAGVKSDLSAGRDSRGAREPDLAPPFVCRCESDLRGDSPGSGRLVQITGA